MRDGKPFTYDRAYYIGEQDFYIPRDEDGNYKKYEAAGEDMADVARGDAHPDADPCRLQRARSVHSPATHALKAKVGETVLFIHAQANRDTRPHLIGGHGDLVWEGGLLQRQAGHQPRDLVHPRRFGRRHGSTRSSSPASTPTSTTT